MELRILSGRVTTLEKLIIQLSHWVKFDLQKFAKDRQDDDDEDRDIKYLRPDGEIIGTKKSSGQPSTTSTSLRRGIAAAAGRRSQKSTARKSTGRPSLSQSTRSRLSPGSKSKSKAKSTSGRSSSSISISTTPRLVLVGGGGENKQKQDNEDDVGLGDVDVKIEPMTKDDDDELVPDDEFILGGLSFGDQDSDDGNDYMFEPQSADSSTSTSGSEDDDDDDSNEDGVKKNGTGKRRRASNRRKSTLGHSGKPLYRNVAPLRLPPVESTAELNPLIKMDKLSPEELTRMNVIIPKPRRVYRKNVPYPCQKCDQVFSSRIEHRKHLKTHPKTKTRAKKQVVPWPCPHCPRTFRHKCKLQHHLKKHSSDRPFLCYHCGHTSKCLSSLNSHIKIMHSTTPREKRFKCDRCDKIFLSSSGLIKHMKKDHGENGRNELEAACHLCTSVFSDSSKLRRHIEDIHDNIRRFACHLCGQLFKRPNHLKKHIERHDNPRRRKRGPQRPMIRGQLIPQPQPEPLEEPEPTVPPLEEEEQLKTVPSSDKEVIVTTSDTSTATPSYLIQGQGQHFQIQIQPHTSGSYATIDQNIVKDFSLAYLQ